MSKKNYYVARLVEHSGHKHGWLFMDAEIFKEKIDALRDTPSINDIKTVEWKNIELKESV